MHDLESEKDELIADPDKLLVIFREMIQMCLWYVLPLLLFSVTGYYDLNLFFQITISSSRTFVSLVFWCEKLSLVVNFS